MKKLLILVLIFGIGVISGKTFGQETKEKEKERKGGFAVGGYDNTRQEQDKAVTKRSVSLPAEGEQAEKAAEVEKEPAAIPAQAPAPQEAESITQKEDKGNAYGKEKAKKEKKDKKDNKEKKNKSKE